MPLSSDKARQMGLKGGRKKGFKLQRTLDKEIAKKHFESRIIKSNDKLINSQLSLAIGQQFLYKIEKEYVETGTDKEGNSKGYWKNLKPKLVESQSEIETYLETVGSEGDATDDQESSDAYYFITTKEPNNMAIDSLYNRVLGKPKETIDVTGEIKFSLKGLADRRKEIEAKTIDVIEVSEEDSNVPQIEL